MPIYEYECGLCGHQLEAMQKFSEAPLTNCPACHKAGLNKLISSTSFQLKGSGWYVTDIRDKNKPKPATTTSDTKSETADTSTKQETVKSTTDKKTE